VRGVLGRGRNVERGRCEEDMEKWERRARKLDARRRRMAVSGRGLLTVLQPAIKRRAEAAKRAREKGDQKAEGSG
jgi:hypothetical protein